MVANMSVPLNDEHVALAATVDEFARAADLLGEARAGLESGSTQLPDSWVDIARMGWLGLHLPEDVGGSGYGLLETVVVAEQLCRFAASGPFGPTVIVSALIDRHGDDELRAQILPALAAGHEVATFVLAPAFEIADGRLSGDDELVMAGPQARWLAVAVGDDVAVVDVLDPGVSLVPVESIDPGRPVGRLRCDGARAVVLSGARNSLTDLVRLVSAAEANGVAGACLDRSVGYAKLREQFGRQIGSFQAIKHHCADMLVETQLAAASVWAAARPRPPVQASLAAAMAATIAIPAARFNAELNIRVHGGIGFTWEEHAHLYLRRALSLAAFCDAETAASDVTRFAQDDVGMADDVELSEEGSHLVAEAADFLGGLRELPADELRRQIVSAGYAVPHWPPPWGRSAGPVERLAVHRAYRQTGVEQPAYGITGWILFALVQHGTSEQVERWIEPGLLGEQIWCQLFSEPDAGSDAAAVRTSAVRVEGGWRVRGHKLWTTHAQKARWGLATVRTDVSVSKHAGLSTMVIDMKDPGVRIRPLRQINGDEEFNEVYLEDVIVADNAVVGAIGDGWTVARTTLAAESSSIGAGVTTITVPVTLLLELWRTRPERLEGGAVRIGRFLSRAQAISSMNLRATFRELSGHRVGAESAVSKLVLAENTHDGTELLRQLAGADGATLEGTGKSVADIGLRVLALAIAGGTSEVKRNQIGERVLGLPREPGTK
jgi:alkylation response protein AidB-like acyl-CoA dehydrogenase